jgi:hypothetical protein
VVTFKETDVWMAKGFGGILNLLHTRVTQFPAGFTRVARLLIEQECKRFQELKDAVVANPQEDGAWPQTDVAWLDNWFNLAFNGLDAHIANRVRDNPEPMSEANIDTLEAHITRMQEIVRQCRSSSGGASTSK